MSKIVSFLLNFYFQSFSSCDKLKKCINISEYLLAICYFDFSLSRFKRYAYYTKAIPFYFLLYIEIRLCTKISYICNLNMVVHWPDSCVVMSIENIGFILISFFFVRLFERLSKTYVYETFFPIELKHDMWAILGWAPAAFMEKFPQHSNINTKTTFNYDWIFMFIIIWFSSWMNMLYVFDMSIKRTRIPENMFILRKVCKMSEHHSSIHKCSSISFLQSWKLFSILLIQ